tara:strand:- start:393 stop:587 length:195 start_codon:yes stop_codon:yes gene_type:complete
MATFGITVSKILVIYVWTCLLTRLASSQELGLGKATITDFEYAGSGCPEGSVTVGGAGSTGYEV